MNLCILTYKYVEMFSEYMETEEPLKDKDSNEELSSDKKNWGEDENHNSKKEKLSEEQNLQNSKRKLNERYDVMSNAYPNGSFEKILSTDENQGKQTKLNISRGEGGTFFSVNMSEIIKLEDGKESIGKNLTLNFKDFVENFSGDSMQGNLKQDEKKQIPNVSLNGDLSMLSNLVEAENGNLQNVFDIKLLDMNSINGRNKIINYIDKNIMRSPVNSVYGYAHKQYVDNVFNDITNKKNGEDVLEQRQLKVDDIRDYILNVVNKDSLSVYQKNVFDVMLSLSIILRNSSIQELADLKNTDTEDKNEKSLLTNISTLTHENVIEYLSSNLDFLLDNNIKDWTLGKYGEQMEIEEFNFLTP